MQRSRNVASLAQHCREYTYVGSRPLYWIGRLKTQMLPKTPSLQHFMLTQPYRIDLVCRKYLGLNSKPVSSVVILTYSHKLKLPSFDKKKKNLFSSLWMLWQFWQKQHLWLLNQGKERPCTLKNLLEPTVSVYDVYYPKGYLRCGLLSH